MGSLTINGETHQVVVPVDSTGEPAKSQAAFRGFASFNRPADSAPYLVGDTVGAAGAGGAVIKLAGIGRAGAHCEIQSVQIKMSGSAVPSGMGAGFRVHFFTAQPINANDNDPFSGSDIDRRIYIDYIDIPTLELIGGGFLTKTNKTDRIRFQLISTDIWAEIVTLASNAFTPTPSASIELNVRGVVTGVPTDTVGNPLYLSSALFLTDTSYRKADQLPAVSWRFAEDRSLTDRIRGLTLPFTRTTTRTFVQADGTWGTVGINEPAFSYLNGVSSGLDIWDPRTNLFLNSEAPATQSITVTAATHTLSFKGTGTVTLTGTSTAGPLVGTGANDRVQLSFTPSAGTLTLTLSGDVREPQLELGTAAGPYIPTAAAAATRAGDICLLTDLSCYDPAGGVFYIEYISPVGATGVTRNVITLSDGTTANRALSIGGNATGGQVLAVSAGGVTQTSIVSTVSAGSLVKSAVLLATDNIGYAVNGGTPGTDTSATLPVPTQLRIGAGAPGAGLLNSTIARLDYYAPGAAASFLQRMTA